MSFFPEKVRELRGAMELTQKELAEKAGLATRMVCSYENGGSFPRRAQLHRLAEALGVSEVYLTNDEIDAPMYGIDHTEHMDEMQQMSGSGDAWNMDALLAKTRTMLASDKVPYEEKEAYTRAVTEAFQEYRNAGQESGHGKAPES